MFKLFSCFRSLAVVSFFALSGCGSRADQKSAPVAATAAIGSTPSTSKAAAPAFTTALDTYIARDEPAYKWEKISEKQIGKNLVTTLKVTSQTWQNIVWTHRVEIARPEKIEFPGWALLYLSTTDSVIESILTQSLAAKMGAVTIHVTGIPNQPLYGKREDALMAHTFSQFIETKDETWPLLLPMTKSAVKAMDAVQEYSLQQQKPLEKFIVTGASKRGWTTWLVGATDTKNRVGGIIPMVYDNLNTAVQMPHQVETWGDFSPMIADYTRNNLQEKMRTPRGMELTKIIDPYHYRTRLTMPKLIVNATNDPYWTVDALNLYWSELPAPKNVYYAPNAGHTMEGDLENVFGTAAAWFRRVAGEKEIPTLNLIGPGRRKGEDFYGFLLLAKGGSAKSARIWMATSPNRDFRKAIWKSLMMNKEDEEWFSIRSKLIGAEFIATFAEVIIESNGTNLRISTPIEIWRAEDVEEIEPPVHQIK